MPPLNVVLFDLDDTLFDHTECSRVALAAVRERFDALLSIDIDMQERLYFDLLEEIHHEVLAARLTLDQARRVRFRRFFDQLGVTASGNDIADAVTIYKQVHRSAWREVPGAGALLESLRGRVSVGIVTNNARDEQIAKLDHLGFSSLVDELVTSGELGIAKPDPEIFRIALERLDRNSEHAVMVGDSWVNDVVGASRSGIAPIWLNRFGAAPQDDTRHEMISTLGDVLPEVEARLPK
jgi:putative hydrolase of the HAD superfamily